MRGRRGPLGLDVMMKTPLCTMEPLTLGSGSRCIHAPVCEQLTSRVDSRLRTVASLAFAVSNSTQTALAQSHASPLVTAERDR